MPRNCGVRFVGEADFLKAALAAAGGLVGGRAEWKEAIDKELRGVVPLQIDGDRAANELTASSEDGEWMLPGPVGGKERFLGQAALMPKGNRLPGIEFCPLFLELCCRVIGEGQIHVV